MPRVPAQATVDIDTPMRQTSAAYDVFVDLLDSGTDADVGASVGYSAPYNRGKVSVYIKVRCGQTEDSVRTAGREVIRVGRDLAKEAMPTVLDDIDEYNQLVQQRTAQGSNY